MHFAPEDSLGGIVFDEICQIVGRYEVIDRDNFISFFEEALFDDCTEDKTTDATEPIDCNIWHDDVVGWCAGGSRGNKNC